MMETKTRRKKSAPNVDIFAQRFKEVIDEAGITRKQLEMDGIATSGMLTQYLHGKCYPCTMILVEICSYFDISADWLLGLSDERHLPV